MPDSTEMLVQTNVPVPMRDGVVLYADVYRPASAGRYPVLLMRTPYSKAMVSAVAGTLDPIRATAAGYVIVAQDVRGRFASGGDFYPWISEAADGYDTVEWCAAQDWASGPVGMFGASYVGFVQWLAAREKPPHLEAIVPIITFADLRTDLVRPGGAMSLGTMLSWHLGAIAPDLLMRKMQRGQASPRQMQALLDQIDKLGAAVKQMRTTDVWPFSDPDLAPGFADLLERADDRDFWIQTDVARDHERIDIPALNIGGWYDIFLNGTLRNYVGVKAPGQRLVMGPWDHGPLGNVVGDVDFGVRAAKLVMDLEDLMLRFFDRHLKGDENGLEAEPPVRLFVMGENVWRTESEWPLSRATTTAYYLASGGRANSLKGDGRLTATPPPAGAHHDAFLYDPRDPVPTRGGPLCCSRTVLPGGAYDQRQVEERADVLVYTSDPLEQPLEVTGPVMLKLWARTSAPDTDFTAKLVDVSPCGYARNLVDGVVRARFRGGLDNPRLLEPGEIVEYEVDMWATSNLFLEGHRIRLEVSSSNFPRFDRNTNSGNPIGTDRDEDIRPALQTIFHDAEHPSRLLLPVVAR